MSSSQMKHTHFIHTLLPTTLLLKEFYAEYHDRYIKGIALDKQLALLQKYPLKELPHLLVKGGQTAQDDLPGL